MMRPEIDGLLLLNLYVTVSVMFSIDVIMIIFLIQIAPTPISAFLAGLYRFCLKAAVNESEGFRQLHGLCQKSLEVSPEVVPVQR